MIVHSRAPLNAEPPLDLLIRSARTEADLFYVRSHGALPRLDAATHRLEIGGLVARPASHTLEALATRLPRRTVTAVLQCAGNRRADLQDVRPTTGDPWAPGAIGCADWTGVGLADLLDDAGAACEPGLHVAFEGADLCEEPGEGRFAYGVSIPMAKARCPDTLIADAMNGRPLTPAHGHPLRAIVPGYAGVRSAKWLTRITVQDHPSDNHMQARDYKLLPPEIGPDDVDWSRGITINEMPLTSAICEPGSGARLGAGRVAVRGYAIATARRIVRVDVSADGGRTWIQAELDAPGERRWAWTLWRAAFDLPRGPCELVVRAWDEAGQTQPARNDDVWNFKGYLSTAWHRVPVSVE